MPSKVRLEHFITLMVKNRSIMVLVTHCFSLIFQSMSSKWKFTFKNRFKKSALYCFHVTINVSSNQKATKG